MALLFIGFLNTFLNSKFQVYFPVKYYGRDDASSISRVWKGLFTWEELRRNKTSSGFKALKFRGGRSEGLGLGVIFLDF